MGIPSFFSYIIRQHTNNVIYRNISKIQFGYLFIDANSLVYDVYNRLLKTPPPSIVKGGVGGGVGSGSGDIEATIINEVGVALEKLIAHIHPTEKTYIAFDGICPFAKMKHQRIRRLKSYILKEAPTTATSTPPFTWDTSVITPGTPFMRKLTDVLRLRFCDNSKVYFSGADIVGEGESKICHHIRELYKTNSRVLLPKIAFYGLDNDIIMLSILHLYCTDNIFVFREEPPLPPSRGGRGGGGGVTGPSFIYINIKTLVASISYEMDCADPHPGRVIDYVFMCFFLGNDFLPKFPALQIRTHGITILLDTYREHIGKFNARRLVSHRSMDGGYVKGVVMNWGWISLFIQKLALIEHPTILIEDEMREKMEASLRRGGDGKRGGVPPLDDPENTPILYREVERYVNPREPGWEWRYYNALFNHNRGGSGGGDGTPHSQKGWCIEYLGGLEWTMRYYTGECPDWRWVYPHEYAPLLQDLQMFVPRAYNWEYFPRKGYRNNPHTAEEQLKYVMPPIEQSVEEKRELVRNTQFQWAYCRYLWEAHVTTSKR
jgi:5'-3' exonuclease